MSVYASHASLCAILRVNVSNRPSCGPERLRFNVSYALMRPMEEGGLMSVMPSCGPWERRSEGNVVNARWCDEEV